MSASAEASFYLAQPPRFVDTGTARLAHRRYGKNDDDAILFVHGWPLSGFTWRKLLPRLAEDHTCITGDLAGAGESEWSPDNDFSFHGHAEHLKRLVDQTGIRRYRIVAHDTGATVARRLAIIDPERVRQLVCIDTEIPHHRPPLVPFFQKVLALPGSNFAFRQLLRSRAYLRSSAGFGGCFVDLDLIDGEFRDHFVTPLIASAHRTEGQIRYARGIDWSQLDALAEDHARIQAPVLLVWGERDPFFPVGEARPMVSQFKECAGLVTIMHTKLLPHEERPDEVRGHIEDFFRDG
jgi:haloalkane dehalogenase